MNSYGTVVIQDGYNTQQIEDPKERRGFVRYVNKSEQPIEPIFFQKPQNIKTFVVDLNFIKDKYVLINSTAKSTNLSIEYKKQLRRVSGKNTINDVASSVAPYSGCEEARKLRKRLIALERIHNSISGESFRFPIINEI